MKINGDNFFISFIIVTRKDDCKPAIVSKSCVRDRNDFMSKRVLPLKHNSRFIAYVGADHDTIIVKTKRDLFFSER